MVRQGQAHSSELFQHACEAYEEQRGVTPLAEFAVDVDVNSGRQPAAGPLHSSSNSWESSQHAEGASAEGFNGGSGEPEAAGPSNGRFLHSGSPAAEWVRVDAALKASHGGGGNVGALEMLAAAAAASVVHHANLAQSAPPRIAMGQLDRPSDAPASASALSRTWPMDSAATVGPLPATGKLPVFTDADAAQLMPFPHALAVAGLTAGHWAAGLTAGHWAAGLTVGHWAADTFCAEADAVQMMPPQLSRAPVETTADVTADGATAEVTAEARPEANMLAWHSAVQQLPFVSQATAGPADCDVVGWPEAERPADRNVAGCWPEAERPMLHPEEEAVAFQQPAARRAAACADVAVAANEMPSTRANRVALQSVGNTVANANSSSHSLLPSVLRAMAAAAVQRPAKGAAAGSQRQPAGRAANAQADSVTCSGGLTTATAAEDAAPGRSRGDQQPLLVPPNKLRLIAQGDTLTAAASAAAASNRRATAAEAMRKLNAMATDQSLSALGRCEMMVKFMMSVAGAPPNN